MAFNALTPSPVRACSAANSPAAGKFSEAAAAFEALVQANPGGALAPNARFGALAC